MTPTAKKVLRETKRFESALPQLLPTLRDRWVVFKDGAVVTDHPNREEAIEAAVRSFGKDGGFVVARVAPRRPLHVGNSGLFFA